MSQFRNLVFEGGGVKGIAYAGAVRSLEKDSLVGNQPILPDVRRVAGTSAGAITAALLALGASGDDIQQIVGSTHFRTFMDDSFGVVRDMERLISEYGWYKGDAFGMWMKKQIQALTDRPDLDFKGLKDLVAKQGTQSPRFRELFVVGTNLSTQLERVFSAETTPDVPIWYAVRISMSIPLFFAAIQDRGDIHVDGGITWNYPIDLFDDRKFQPAAGAFENPKTKSRYGPDHVYNKETLGFRVDTADEIAAEKKGWRAPPRPIDNFVDYARALVGFIMDNAAKRHLEESDWHRTVFIDAKEVRTTEFDLSDSQVHDLVNSGMQGTKDYFTWFTASSSKPQNRTVPK